MNKEFEQWREQTFTLTVIGRDMINKVYNHLQTNPHLLREDGEKETDMETEAENLYKKVVTDKKHTLSDRMKEIFISALTEFGEMCKQRGREEMSPAYLNLVEEVIPGLQQQLAEKELIINEWKQVWKPIDEEISKHPSLKLGDRKSLKVAEIIAELTAAKAEIERLKNENGNLELALKNL